MPPIGLNIGHKYLQMTMLTGKFRLSAVDLSIPHFVDKTNNYVEIKDVQSESNHNHNFGLESNLHHILMAKPGIRHCVRIMSSLVKNSLNIFIGCFTLIQVATAMKCPRKQDTTLEGTSPTTIWRWCSKSLPTWPIWSSIHKKGFSSNSMFGLDSVQWHEKRIYISVNWHPRNTSRFCMSSQVSICFSIF